MVAEMIRDFDEKGRKVCFFVDRPTIAGSGKTNLTVVASFRRQPVSGL